MYYQTCPKCGHQRQRSDTLAKDRCPACGLIYAKWFRSRFALARVRPDKAPGTRRRLHDMLMAGATSSKPQNFYLYCILLAVMVGWGWYFMQLEYYSVVNGQRVDSAAPAIYDSFLHGVNLIFHEAGHVLFAPFGEFMAVLGGSLMQLLVPLVCGIALLKKGEPFGAAFALWWTGQNLLDLAPYINDARSGNIVLLGGVTGSEDPQRHDWWNILNSLGWLQHDHALAALVHGSGLVVMLLSLLWAASVLRYQYLAMRGDRAVP
jgi:hypothetical protein